MGILNGSEVGLRDFSVIGGNFLFFLVYSLKDEMIIIMLICYPFFPIKLHIFSVSIIIHITFLSLFLDITLQDLMVVYDNENGQIGWIKAACDRLPKSGSSIL